LRFNLKKVLKGSERRPFISSMSNAISQADRQTVSEIRAYALEIGECEIAAECEAALRGDKTALGYIRMDVDTRADFARWRPLPATGV
jgi:hypothetical protein